MGAGTDVKQQAQRRGRNDRANEGAGGEQGTQHRLHTGCVRSTPLTAACVPLRCPPHTSQCCCRWEQATVPHFWQRRSCSW